MIRPAGHSDVDAITRLMKAEPGFWQSSWPDNIVARVLESPSCLAFVYSLNGGIAGFASAHDLNFRGYLSELIVSPSHRGRGVGKKLIDAVEGALRSRGCPLIIADVWREAEGFYRSRGWEPPDAVLLRKRLAFP
ncbi:GNAT family N-acetyltransferase [Lacipirellula limnantheis]|uniref:Acetyltransferase YpeA n=1 Tax=Lacipirellula limnantheis TaxID=2528024 RepID=A0A517U0B0_9BACT|nr:GNAT family N-acetyltransferase [Lacipirellula limnantheis]QDT74066.1 Acetyltransferase YpeA [Lacipirellula limnantheis]